MVSQRQPSAIAATAMMTTPPATSRADTSFTGSGNPMIRYWRGAGEMEAIDSLSTQVARKVPSRCHTPVKPLKGPPLMALVHSTVYRLVDGSNVPVARPVAPGFGAPWLKNCPFHETLSALRSARRVDPAMVRLGGGTLRPVCGSVGLVDIPKGTAKKGAGLMTASDREAPPSAKGGFGSA